MHAKYSVHFYSTLKMMKNSEMPTIKITVPYTFVSRCLLDVETFKNHLKKVVLNPYLLTAYNRGLKLSCTCGPHCDEKRARGPHKEENMTMRATKVAKSALIPHKTVILAII